MEGQVDTQKFVDSIINQTAVPREEAAAAAPQIQEQPVTQTAQEPVNQPTTEPVVAKTEPSEENPSFSKDTAFAIKDILGDDFDLTGHTPDTIKALLQKSKGYGELETALNQTKTEYDNALRVLSQFKDPFTDMPEIRQMYIAKKQLGVSDPQVMTSVVNATEDSLANDILSTIALSAALKNPTLMQGRFASTFQDLRENARIELEAKGWEEGKPIEGALKPLVNEAINTVLQKQALVKDAKVDFIEEYQNTRNNLIQGAEKRYNEVKSTMADKATQLYQSDFTAKHGDKPYQLLKDAGEASKYIDEAVKALVSNGVEKITPEIIAAQARAIYFYNKPLSGLLDPVVGELNVDIKKALEKEYANGQPISRAVNTEGNKTASTDKFIENLVKESPYSV